LSKEEALAQNCEWIETRHGSMYSRGSDTIPYTRRKTETQHQNIAWESKHASPLLSDEELFENDRFQPNKWHRLPTNVKNQVFTPQGLDYFQQVANDVQQPELKDAFAKYCRCLYEVPTKEVLQHGQVVSQPYAICNASISRAWGGKSQDNLRSVLSRIARAGNCTEYLNVDNIPTPYLYGWLHNHLSTTKGRRHFQGKVPPVDEFVHDMNKWRPLFIQWIREYQKKA
jgi:hypothetical protein